MKHECPYCGNIDEEESTYAGEGDNYITSKETYAKEYHTCTNHECYRDFIVVLEFTLLYATVSTDE